MVKRRSYLLALLVWLLGVACASTVPNSAKAAQEKTKKVLVIGIDGLRPDALAKAETPFLDALIKDGAYADDAQILGQRYRKSDTVSGPGWSSILTGVWADKHGVQENDFRKTRLHKWPDFMTRLKEARPQARTASFVSWHPIARDIVTADVNRFYDTRGKQAEGYAKEEFKLAKEAQKFLAEDNPDAMFVYFGLTDVVGHTKGFHPESKEYLSSITLIDEYVGLVIRGMIARQTFSKEDWLILVTSDHGGRGTQHKDGQDVPVILNVPLIVSGPAAARGKIAEQTCIVDVPVTALVHLGIDRKELKKLDGRPVGLKQ